MSAINGRNTGLCVCVVFFLSFSWTQQINDFKCRCMVELAIPELEKKLKEHEKNPEKHPLYPEEWKKFWNRRYKELQTGNMVGVCFFFWLIRKLTFVFLFNYIY